MSVLYQRAHTQFRRSWLIRRLWAGEDLESVSRAVGITAARASHWRAQFLAAGQAGLKSRATDARDEDHRRLQAKIGRAGLDLNATQAAIRAGYSPKTAMFIGHENLRKPKIKTVLAESEAKALAKADLSAQNVLEAIRRHLMRDVRQLVGKDGTFKKLEELSLDEAGIIDKIVEDADGTVTYRFESLHKWVEMAAQHFSLLTERVEMVDPRHIEDKLIEARERAVKAGHAKKYPDIGKAT